jgi:D-glycero-D-manno-heptose 1,7-bisphosphate phosphatase
LINMPNKAIFLDRDDTLIDDPGYLNDPGQVRLLSGAARALAQFKAMGYKLIVVTNQSAIARGIITEKTLRNIHDRLEHLLARENASLDAIYYCPYHPEGSVAKFRKESDNRKPNPGMLLAAADEFDIDLGESWMIGNAPHDVEAGLRAGCKTILIDLPSRQNQAGPSDPAPHFRAVNITEALNIVKKNNRQAKDAAPAEQESADELEPEQEPNAPESELSQDPDPEPEKPRPITQQPQIVVEEPKPEPPEESAPSEEETERHYPQQDEPNTVSRREEHAATTEQLLSSILDQLKSSNRKDMFDESFSAWRFMAGAVQGLVALCMLITIWLLMSPDRHDTSVLISLGFATVLQLTALTFFVIQDRK